MEPKPIPALKSITEMSDEDVAAELSALIESGAADEQRALLYIARRVITLGQSQYDKLDLKTDPRDGIAERNEETGDLLFYHAFAALKAELRMRGHS